MLLRSSEEQRSAGQRKGTGEGIVGGNRYCELGGPGKGSSME